MNDFFRESLFAGVTLSLLSYFIGSVLKKKFKLGIFNPLLISIIITIIVLAVSGVDYDVYNQGARYLSWFLTPATVYSCRCKKPAKIPGTLIIYIIINT